MNYPRKSRTIPQKISSPSWCMAFPEGVPSTSLAFGWEVLYWISRSATGFTTPSLTFCVYTRLSNHETLRTGLQIPSGCGARLALLAHPIARQDLHSRITFNRTRRKQSCAGSQAGALDVIQKSDQARNFVIPAGIAGIQKPWRANSSISKCLIL